MNYAETAFTIFYTIELLLRPSACVLCDDMCAHVISMVVCETRLCIFSTSQYRPEPSVSSCHNFMYLLQLENSTCCMVLYLTILQRTIYHCDSSRTLLCHTLPYLSLSGRPRKPFFLFCVSCLLVSFSAKRVSLVSKSCPQ